MTKNCTNNYYDVAIVGGGLAGASLALSLAKHNFKLAVLDNAPKINNQTSNGNQTSSQSNHLVPQQVQRSARALALSLPSVQFLEDLNREVIHRTITEAEPIRGLHVSNKGCFGVTQILAEDEGLASLGKVVNADALNQALNHALEEASVNIDLLKPVEVVDFSKLASKHWEISLNTGRVIQAKLLVAADGTDSFVRRYQGIDIKEHDYQQTAIVCNLTLERSHAGIAYERFLPNGTIAMLPFGKNRVKCVWVLETAVANSLCQLTESKFLALAQKAFGYRLGQFQTLDKRIEFPLKSIAAETIYGQQFVLIGNAANTLHPVAAQGFNLALRDVKNLSKILVAAKEQEEDVGNITLLQTYAQTRAEDHLLTGQFNDSLTKTDPIISLGIIACEFVPFIKQQVVKMGMGKLILANS